MNKIYALLFAAAFITPAFAQRTATAFTATPAMIAEGDQQDMTPAKMKKARKVKRMKKAPKVKAPAAIIDSADTTAKR